MNQSNGNDGGAHRTNSTMKMALAGAAVGAAVVALSHKPTRDKVIHALDTWGNKIDDAKAKGKQKVDELAVKTHLAKDEAEEQLKSVTQRSKRGARDVSDTV